MFLWFKRDVCFLRFFKNVVVIFFVSEIIEMVVIIIVFKIYWFVVLFLGLDFIGESSY